MTDEQKKFLSEYISSLPAEKMKKAAKDLEKMINDLKDLDKKKINSIRIKKQLIEAIVDELNEKQWKRCRKYISDALCESDKSPFYISSNIRRVDLKNILWDCGSITNPDDNWLAFIYDTIKNKSIACTNNRRMKSYYSLIEDKISRFRIIIEISEPIIRWSEYIDCMIDIMMLFLALERGLSNNYTPEFKENDFNVISVHRSSLHFYRMSIILIELGLEAQGQ